MPDELPNPNLPVPEPPREVLSEAQKLAILTLWNESDPLSPPSLKELIFIAWKEEIDPREYKGRLVREFLASRHLKANSTKKQRKIEPLDAAAEQFIVEHHKEMGPCEMARFIYKNNEITGFSGETRIVKEFIANNTKAISEIIDVNDEDGHYRPPKHLMPAITRVNKYLHKGLDANKVTAEHKKWMATMIGYLHTLRFISQIETYSSPKDRELFESEFIRCTYDKPDLTEEEVDQYIIYATEVVIGKTISARIQLLEEEQDRSLEETGKINMALVEAVKSLRQEHNFCIKRQNDLLDALKGERKERISNNVKENAGILNLITLWKEEESRKQLIELANKEKELVRDEIKRLSSMDELRSRILGLSEDEALMG
jgi:hypothetical protein